MKKAGFLFVLFVLSNSIQAQKLEEFFKKSNDFFSTYVVSNKVDYELLKKNPRPLEDILSLATDMDLNNRDTNTFKAFWVNIYNLTVIKGIVNKYPIKSTQSVNGFFDKNYYKIAKQEVTLKDIEKNVLKSTFKDPLLNFVLVCAANGCPPLMDEAYYPETLSKQMIERTKLSINNPNFIKVNKSAKTIEVSEIFDWYKEDFIDKGKKIIDFINTYRDVKIDESYQVAFYKYDWSLNVLNKNNVK
jgi:hypothetical protein